MMNMIITLAYMKLIGQDDMYDEKKLLFWFICYVLSLLSSINLKL